MNRSPYVALMRAPGAPGFEHLRHFTDSLRGSHGLDVLVDTPELLVFGAADAAHVELPDDGGIIWGHLFETVTGVRANADSTGLDLPCRDFLARYWGGYVAIRRRKNAVEVLRDPSGIVGCYHAEVGGISLVTSAPALLVRQELVRAEIDWSIIAQVLAYRDLRPARTALRGISEVLPGVVGQVTDTAFATCTAWSPWHFAKPDREDRDFADAVANVGAALRGSLESWGSAFIRPLVEISGGFDSAVVAAGMHLGNARLETATFGPVEGDADERPYAQALAAHLGVPIEVLNLELADIDLTHSDAADLPRPCARVFSQALDRPLQRRARMIGADAFFGGAGGDNVFCHLQSALPVVDRLRRFGPGGLVRTAGAIARQTQTTTWQVLASAARRALRPLGCLPVPRTNRFLSSEAIADLPWPHGHPWLDAPSWALPGKRRHIWSLIGIQNHFEGFGREAIAPVISPLMSQPVLEACLAVPSWLWFEGSHDRAVARAAFRSLLPDAIVQRRTKGGFDSFASAIIARDRPLLRELLLGGQLARNGLLDLAAVSRSLSADSHDVDGIPQLLALADIEAWVNAWQVRST